MQSKKQGAAEQGTMSEHTNQKGGMSVYKTRGCSPLLKVPLFKKPHAEKKLSRPLHPTLPSDFIAW